jgi:hypothetical protein
MIMPRNSKPTTDQRCVGVIEVGFKASVGQNITGAAGKTALLKMFVATLAFCCHNGKLVDSTTEVER